jgi:hypothetical protein
MPLTIVQFSGNRAAGESAWATSVIAVTTYLQHGSPLYMFLYGAGIVFFCFFYTSSCSTPRRRRENLKKYGRLHSRASAPARDRGISRSRADPRHRGRRRLSSPPSA